MTTSNDNSITITGISGNSITSTPYTISTMASDTITFPYTNSNSGTFTINSGSGYGTISSSSSIYDSIHSDWFTQTLVPFSNSWPDYVDFQKMAKEYPGLEIAYEKLKTTYKLCIDDWEEQKRNKNDK